MSNRNNRLQAAGLLGGGVQSNERGVETFTFADGDSMTYPVSPIDTTNSEPAPGYEDKEPRLRRYVERDPAGEQANQALWATASLAHETRRVSQDARLTEHGRNDALKEVRGAAVANVALAWSKLAEHEVGLIEREHKLYEFPQLERGDAVGALLDREARDYARSLTGSARDELMRQLRAGEAERVTLALLRSPVPFGNLETTATQAWRSAIERRNPQEVELLAAQHEQLDWARLLVKRAAEKVAQKSNLSGYALFEAASAFTPAQPHGPGAFFGTAELRAYRVRAATMKARAA